MKTRIRQIWVTELRTLYALDTKARGAGCCSGPLTSASNSRLGVLSLSTPRNGTTRRRFLLTVNNSDITFDGSKDLGVSRVSPPKNVPSNTNTFRRIC
jgi:hypothetical protein